MQKINRPVGGKSKGKAMRSAQRVPPPPVIPNTRRQPWADANTMDVHVQGPTYNLQVTVLSPIGLHLRPAAILAKLATQFDCTISLQYAGREANARSLLSVVLLQAGPGAQLTVSAQGPDAAIAAASLSALFSTDFDEPADKLMQTAGMLA